MRSLLSISAINFRSLRKVDVELQELSVLVGPNGAGKTNLLRVIQFLGDMSRLDLAPAIERHGGFESLAFRGKVAGRRLIGATRIGLTIKTVATSYASVKTPDVYQLSFWQAPLGSNASKTLVTRRHESIQFKRTKGRGRRITVSGGRVSISETDRKDQKIAMSPQSSALSTLRKLSQQEGAHEIQKIANLFETFRVFEVDVNAARRPSMELHSKQLASDASNLSAFIGYLFAEHADIFAMIQEDLTRISPNIATLGVERGLLGTGEGVAVYFQEHGLPGKTYLVDASFGTIRALALLAMLHDPHPPRITCVEEIDHGLHPHALDVIVERLRSASSRTQLLVATHSPALVNRLLPSELIVCERNLADGSSLIPAISSEDIEEMVDASNLLPGELWFSGALGGGLGN